MPEVDLYEVLGVGREATPAELKTAYRRLAKTMHPDAGGTVGTFRLLRDAYDTLADPVLRARYDSGGGKVVPVRPAPRPRRKFGEEPGFVPELPDLDAGELEWWHFAGQDTRVRHGRQRGPGHTPVVAAVAGMVLVLLPLVTGVGFSAPVLVVWLLPELPLREQNLLDDGKAAQTTGATAPETAPETAPVPVPGRVAR